MFKSIRNKLFLTVIAIVMLLILILYGLNALYFEEFYVQNKTAVLDKATDEIDALYKGDLGSVSEDFYLMQENLNMNITIFDMKSGNVKFDGSSNQNQNKKINFYFNSFTEDEFDRLYKGEKVQFSVSYGTADSTFLVLAHLMDTGDLLILETPVQAISDAIEITNSFYMFTCIMVILIGIVLAYFFSRRFTEPIIELNEIADKMSHLDFSRKYQADNQDEIGELGRSINYMSEKLEKTIESLNDKNADLMDDIEKKEKVDRARKKFISSVSHELKTPITLIQGYSEAIKEKINTSPEQMEYYCDVIINESERMNHLVLNLLKLSKLDMGSETLHEKVFDLSGLVDDVLYKYHLVIKDKKIKIDIDKEDIVFVKADRHKIEQVIMNLVSNSINYLDANNKIAVRIIEMDRVNRLSIYNTCDEIPEDALEYIFDSFYRVDDSGSRKFGGTGLGLSIVKSILELHDLKYDLRNVRNGVEFYVDFQKPEDR